MVSLPRCGEEAPEVLHGGAEFVKAPRRGGAARRRMPRRLWRGRRETTTVLAQSCVDMRGGAVVSSVRARRHRRRMSPERQACVADEGARRVSPRKSMEAASGMTDAVVAAMTTTMTGAATTPATTSHSFRGEC